jgi:GH15 family glucan-1,4-alpha-glucosidase
MLIEDYALIGDTHTAALVGRDGSLDWLCVPRFDSPACFAALLGRPEHGRLLLAPRGAGLSTARRYLPDTLVLETTFRTAAGEVRLIDFMPMRSGRPMVVRIVEGVSGRVPMRLHLALRFDYGALKPWLRPEGRRMHAVAGPDGLTLETPVRLAVEEGDVTADFVVGEGDRVPFTLTWFPSHEPPGGAVDAERALEATVEAWRRWASRCEAAGPHREAIVRSSITLKALTYAPTGGIVAAATTSLPETLGGERNWDYRYVWLRDATFMLLGLLQGGYREEAVAWRDWLLRAVAGEPSKLRVMYGVTGGRELTERTVDGLPGYEGSRPVRVGNGAAGQLQLDVYGELVDLMHQARRLGVESEPAAWELERAVVEWLETAWTRPDQGLWESRGEARHFTHSKVMTWVAMDRAVKSVELQGMPGDAARWAAVRGAIHREVCERGYDPRRGTFTRSYGSDELDASLLLIPAVGFLPPEDPRVVGTIRAVERELLRDGYVRRYPTSHGVNDDGLPGEDQPFLACSFWLVDAYALTGRRAEAEALFGRLLAIRNDVGLLSEEYDTARGRLVGNFPQVFSHVALINSARSLAGDAGPVQHRKRT